MQLYIKNMVCKRCIMAVEKVLSDSGLHVQQSTLGEVSITEPSLSSLQKKEIDSHLRQLGFELINDKNSRLIEQVKNIIVNTIHYQQDQPQLNWSELLARDIGRDYSYISKLFSEVEGFTIEQYVIRQKIERVKELLVYDELSLGEIAWQLGYSSIAHLSAQFKKHTGLTPTHFKTIGKHHRNPIDHV